MSGKNIENTYVGHLQTELGKLNGYIKENNNGTTYTRSKKAISIHKELANIIGNLDNIFPEEYAKCWTTK
jgi:hypothetical protein